jgi:diacylglycerol kinase (ATP)
MQHRRSPVRAALILNPAARAGDHSPEEILSALATSGVEAALVPVEDGIPSALRAALSAHPDAVIVGGGDGTLSTAADVLCGCDVPLGILSLGTANDFARTTGIPRDLEQGAQSSARGTPPPSTLVSPMGATSSTWPRSACPRRSRRCSAMT